LLSMPRPIRALDISSEPRRALRVIVNRPTVAQRDHRRAWIILNRANGLSQMETARKVGVGRRVVIHWEQQFRQTGVAGLSEAKGRGRQEQIEPEMREKIIGGETHPPAQRAQWT